MDLWPQPADLRDDFCHSGNERVGRAFGSQNAGCLQAPGVISQQKMNPVRQQGSLPGLCSSISPQPKPTGDGASAAGDGCGVLSVGVDLSQIPTDCLTDAAMLTAAAMLKAGRAPRLHRAALSSPILSASLLHA